ncbi:hypothetical protein Tcan_18113 [Toxocara canis]|uniref:Uncharacterized protein n=2 Tax=Toxocara canis TaxID=6265 RepID=A0A0B2UYN4_TOXCA|nr:hypothetical protein Tcan_18113 [Toxocara canis]VDM23896.1 unnamed protein product [Toxocara canis]
MMFTSLALFVLYGSKAVCCAASGSSYSYERAASNRGDVPKISRVYHYDNLTDCEWACDVKCEVTHVVYNDEHERRQYSCRRRKPPRNRSSAHPATKRGFTFLFLAATVMACCVVLLCCCCCCSWCCGGWTPRQSPPNAASLQIGSAYADGFKEHIDITCAEEDNIGKSI